MNEHTKIYLIVTSIIYIVYFLTMLPNRMKNLDEWKKYHYDNEKENNCKDDEAIECIRSGRLIERYIMTNINYIALRLLCLYKPEFFPLVFLDNVKRVTNHMLRWKKWGFHYFLVYHFTCLMIDIKLLFFN